MSSLVTTHVSSSTPYLTCKLQGNPVYGNCPKTFQLPSARISGTACTVVALHITLSPNVILLLPIEEWIFMLSFLIASCGYAHMLYTVGSPRPHATWIWVLRAYPKVWISSCPFLDCKVLGARSRVQFFLTVPISSLLVVYSRSSYLAHHRASMNVEQMNWFFSHKYHTTHLPIPMLDVD